MTEEAKNPIKTSVSKSLTALGSASLRYRKQRYSHMRRGWGIPLFHPLWLEAIVYAIIRARHLTSHNFNQWCDEIDILLINQHDMIHHYTVGTGRDCWIEAFTDGLSPQDAVDGEIEHWD